MSKTYIHIQKGKFKALHREYMKFVQPLRRFRFKWLHYWQQSDEFSDLFDNFQNGKFSRYAKQCSRHNSDWVDFHLTRNRKRQKIAEKDFKEQLNEYYLYSQKNKL